MKLVKDIKKAFKHSEHQFEPNLASEKNFWSGTSFDNIVHVGAHFGQEANEYNSLTKGKIIWIEADPTNFTKLVEEISQVPNHNNHVLINKFCSSSQGAEVDFYVYSNEGASNSRYLPTKRFGKYWSFISVVDRKILRTSTLDSILQQHKFSGVNNLLVLDVQGHELDVLKGSTKSLHLFSHIVCELSIKKVYSGQASYKSIVKFLERGDFFFINPNLMNHYNGLFIRRSILTHPNGFSSEK